MAGLRRRGALGEIRESAFVVCYQRIRKKGSSRGDETHYFLAAWRSWKDFESLLTSSATRIRKKGSSRGDETHFSFGSIALVASRDVWNKSTR
jgi:hypothetical protein